MAYRRSTSLAALLAAEILVSIIVGRATAQPLPNVPLPPGAWAEAQYQVGRFDKAFHSGGMTGVSADISNCYSDAMQSGQRLLLRECLVYDDFADRFAGMAFRQNPNLPIPPYFVPAAAYQRFAHYSAPAGFNDAQTLSGYLRQGSNSMFAALSALNHRPR